MPASRINPNPPIATLSRISRGMNDQSGRSTRLASRLALLGIVLTLALTAILIACGGDSSGSGGEDRTPTRSQPADAGESPGKGISNGPAVTPLAEPEATQEANPDPTRRGIFGTGSQSTAGQEATEEPTSVATDREALVALYNVTDGPNWKYANWLRDAPLGEWGASPPTTTGALQSCGSAGTS